jgi:microcystin-dependent protein
MPGSPPASPVFGAPRYSDADAATFAEQLNPVTDTFDSLAVRNDDPRLTNTRAPAANSVTTSTIADGAVTAQKIAPNTVSELNLAPNSVGSPEIIDGSIQAQDIATGAIIASKLAAAAVGTAALADAGVTLAKLVSAVQLALNAPGDLVVSAAATRAGCVLCDGSAYSRTDPVYANLYAAIGTSYGVGDGVNTFNVPDYRGRTIVGAGAGPGLTARARGQSFGEESHVMSTAEMPSHAHPISDPGHAHSIYDPAHAHSISDPGHAHQFYSRGDIARGSGASFAYVAWGAPGSVTYASGTGIGIYAAYTGIGIYAAATGVTEGAVGGGAAHNNVQPSVAVNVFIKL